MNELSEEDARELRGLATRLSALLDAAGDGDDGDVDPLDAWEKEEEANALANALATQLQALELPATAALLAHRARIDAEKARLSAAEAEGEDGKDMNCAECGTVTPAVIVGGSGQYFCAECGTDVAGSASVQAMEALLEHDEVRTRTLVLRAAAQVMQDKAALAAVGPAFRQQVDKLVAAIRAAGLPVERVEEQGEEGGEEKRTE